MEGMINILAVDVVEGDGDIELAPSLLFNAERSLLEDYTRVSGTEPPISHLTLLGADEGRVQMVDHLLKDIGLHFLSLLV